MSIPPLAQRIAWVALGQGGAIGTAQLNGLGADSKTIGRLVRESWIERVHAGAYRLVGHPLTDRGRAFLTLFAYGPRAVLSARSAAFAHGFIEQLGWPVHVTLRTARRERPGVEVHTASLERADLRRIGGLATTSISRMLLDLAATGPDPLLRLVIRKVAEKDQLNTSAVESLVQRCSRHQGITALRAALRDRDPNRGMTRSGLEVATSEFLTRHGFPPAERNVLVDLAGEIVTLADFVWWWAECCLEMDHESTHGTSERFAEDRRISRRLQAAGWSTPRATGIDIGPGARGEEFAADLWRILEAAIERWWLPEGWSGPAFRSP